jgi:hypothetical protein
MIDVGGDNHATAGDFIAHEFWGELLAVGNVAHFFRDYSLARIVHLRKIAIRVLLFAACDPISARPGNAVAVATVRAICGIHDQSDLVEGFVFLDYTRRWGSRGGAWFIHCSAEAKSASI